MHVWASELGDARKVLNLNICSWARRKCPVVTHMGACLATYW